MAARLALSSGGTSARLLISPTAGGTQASRGSPTSQRSSHNRSCPPSSGDRVGGEHVRSVFGTDAVGVQAKSWREFLMHKNAALVPHSLLGIFLFFFAMSRGSRQICPRQTTLHQEGVHSPSTLLRVACRPHYRASIVSHRASSHGRGISRVKVMRRISVPG